MGDSHDATPTRAGSDRAARSWRAPGAVHVVAPSGPVDQARLRRGLAHVRQQAGAPTLAANLEMREGYFAGDDRERLAALDHALRDEQATIIWAARGGYGATRLLSRLAVEPLRERPKRIVGFSDITALLCWAYVHADISGIHGPVIGQLDELGEDDRQRLWDLLDGDVPAPLVAEQGTVLHGGRVEGTLIAANLEVLRSLIGTPHMPSLAGCILALEDVGERPYRIDRALTQLLDSGALRRVAGVVVGDLHRCVEPEDGGSQGWTVEQVLDDRLGRLGVPVLIGLGFGHAPDRNAALGFGVRARLDADNGALEQLDPI